MKKTLFSGLCVILVMIPFPLGGISRFINRAATSCRETFRKCGRPLLLDRPMAKPDEVISPRTPISRMKDALYPFIGSPDRFRDIAKERVPISPTGGRSCDRQAGFFKTDANALLIPYAVVIRTQVKFPCEQKFGNALALSTSRRISMISSGRREADKIGAAVTLKRGISVRYTRLRTCRTFSRRTRHLGKRQDTMDQWTVAC